MARYAPKHRRNDAVGPFGVQLRTPPTDLPGRSLSARSRRRHANVASRRAANRAYVGLALFVSSIAVAATTTYGFGPAAVTAQDVVLPGGSPLPSAVFPVAFDGLTGSSGLRVSPGSPGSSGSHVSVPATIASRAAPAAGFPRIAPPTGRIDVLSTNVLAAPSPDSATPASSSAATNARPAFVRIPSIGTTSNLVDLGLYADGSLEVPTDFSVAGWFKNGVIPGAPGPAIIAGHYDSYVGPAVFSKLSQVKPGDPIEVTMADGSLVEFAVERIDRYPKDYFPDEQVYGDTDRPELRLITCGGSFDKTKVSYNDNIVVYARML